MPQELREVYQLIGDSLDEVEQLMLRSIDGKDPFIAEVMQYGLQFGGKRLRAALVLLAGRLFGPVNQNHVRSAAVIEMIHVATLLHDDILDGARLRRHLQTVNVRWNQVTGILTGDLLFTRAMQLLTQSDDLVAYREISQAANATCEGELRQIGTKGRFDLTKEEYFSIISQKTAALFSCSCRLGARFSNASEAQCQQLAEFGERIGIAFQIVDDILDLTGQEDSVGKTLGTDLLERKLTLPVIHYLETANVSDREQMLERLNRSEMTVEEGKEIVGMLRKQGAIDFAYQQVRGLVQSAIQLIQQSHIPSAHSPVQALTALAHFVLARNR